MDWGLWNNELKGGFLLQSASVRHLGHSNVKVTYTTAIANKKNGCVYSELRDELKPPWLRLGDWRRVMSTPSISCDSADMCGWALENWLAICGMVPHSSHSESQGLERIPDHGTTDLPWIQSPIFCLGNGPGPPKLIKDPQIRVSRDDDSKGLCCPPDWSALPSRGPASHKEAKDGKAIWSLPFSTDAGCHKN